MREMPYHILKDVVGHNYKLIKKQGYERYKRIDDAKPTFVFKMEIPDSSQSNGTTTITKHINIGDYSPSELKAIALRAGINIDRAKRLDENWESKVAIQIFRQAPNIDLE
ncbi:hypothetical protein JCM19240_5355 [Vibrio maritimus]|uniref:Uncharacterized protein n=1 Tax=Vibrio maritimus TaxID=990268 RepID=A0A090SZQ8_9VIBR|nr:hypothetical protein JCM19240_5355 [Vibrio maritimus]